MNTPTHLNGLARRLVADNLLDSEVARKALAQSAKEKMPFVQHLVINGLLDSRTIAKAASEEFGAPLFDLDALSKDAIPDKLVDEKLIRKHHALPIIKRGTRLFLAVADPTDLHALDEIKFNTGLNTDAILVESDKLAAAIEKFLPAQDTLNDALGGLDDTDLDNMDIQTVDTNTAADENVSEADEAPI